MLFTVVQIIKFYLIFLSILPVSGPPDSELRSRDPADMGPGVVCRLGCIAGVELRLLGVEVSGNMLDLGPQSPSSDDFSGVNRVEGACKGFRHFLMGEASETSEDADSDLSRFDFNSSIYFSKKS